MATASMCWSIPASTHLVVIMGTQHYDGSGSGGSDYAVTDLLQMMGRASRPLKDSCGRLEASACFTVLCFCAEL